MANAWRLGASDEVSFLEDPRAQVNYLLGNDPHRGLQEELLVH